MYNRGQSTMLECLLDQGVLGKIGIVDPFYKWRNRTRKRKFSHGHMDTVVVIKTVQKYSISPPFIHKSGSYFSNLLEIKDGHMTSWGNLWSLYVIHHIPFSL